MLTAIIGTKAYQSQQFDAQGKRIPVTYIQVGSLTVTSVKTGEKDGYDAVQLGFGSRRVKTISQALKGHLKKAGLENKPPRFLREVRLVSRERVNPEENLPGKVVNVSDVFKVNTVSIL